MSFVAPEQQECNSWIQACLSSFLEETTASDDENLALVYDVSNATKNSIKLETDQRRTDADIYRESYESLSFSDISETKCLNLCPYFRRRGSHCMVNLIVSDIMTLR
jgi:hypothetical protein